MCVAERNFPKDAETSFIVARIWIYQIEIGSFAMQCCKVSDGCGVGSTEMVRACGYHKLGLNSMCC